MDSSLTLPGVDSSGLDSLHLFGKSLNNLKWTVPKILKGTGKSDKFGKGGSLS